MRVNWLPAALAFLCAPMALSQRPPDFPRAEASVELKLLEIEAVVADPKGNPVRGLAPSDFVVTHGGRRVAITNFREERPDREGEAGPLIQQGTARQEATGTAGLPGVVSGVSPAGGPPMTAASRPRRHLALFFDRLELPEPDERQEYFASMKRLLRKTLSSDDDAMVVSWNGAGQTVVPFTSDLAVLEEAVDAAARLAVRRPTEQDEIDRIAGDEAATRAAGKGLTPDSSMDIHLLETRAYRDVKAKGAVMRGLLSILAGMDGRKVLVVATRRFSRFAGQEFGRGGIDTAEIRDAVADAANAAGVTIYAVDSRPFDPTIPSAAMSPALYPMFNNPTVPPVGFGKFEAAWRNEMQNLDVLATKTGGVAGSIRESDAVSDRLAKDLDSWYSLGYPAPPGAPRSAGVSVAVKGRQLVVRSRQTLVRKSPEEQMTERVLSHFFRPDPRAAIPVTATAKAGPPVDGKIPVRIEVKVPIEALVLVPTGTGAKGGFSVFAVAVDPRGGFPESARQSRPFEIPNADLEKAKAGHFTYELTVDTESPGSRICVGVLDEVGLDAGFTIVSLPRT